MNAPYAGFALFWSTRIAGVRRMFPAPFGLYTRYMLSAYAQDTFLVMSAVLVVALSMDLSHYLGQVLAAAHGDTGLAAALYLGWYITLRSADQITEFLPLASFLGVLWAEVRQTASRERLIVLITGRAPLQCLAPLFIFAILIASLEYLLIVHWRPDAVMKQTAAHLGMYGDRFNRNPTSQPVWIGAGNNLVRSNIDYTSSTLRDLRVFQVSSDHRLHQVILASSATPIADGTNWMFHDGRRVSVDAAALPSTANSLELPQAVPGEEMPFETMVFPLGINPTWLRYFGVNARYIPDDAFEALSGPNFHPTSEYRTWSQARLAIPIGAGAMVVMAGCLSALLLATEIRLSTILMLVAVGYVSHLLTKLSLVLGDYGWVYPFLAAWLVPLLILICPLGVFQLVRQRRPQPAIPALQDNPVYVQGHMQIRRRRKD
jgi:lipopolysaccharide export system permease protein